MHGWRKLSSAFGHVRCGLGDGLFVGGEEKNAYTISILEMTMIMKKKKRSQEAEKTEDHIKKYNKKA